MRQIGGAAIGRERIHAFAELSRVCAKFSCGFMKKTDLPRERNDELVPGVPHGAE